MTSTPQPVLNIVLPKLYYYAGEVVAGKLVYSPKQDKSIHGIHIHFTGFEFCENHMLADVPFQKKWILDGSTTVHGHKCVINRAGHQTTTHKYAESEGITVKAGDYSWPFSFQIPKNIPPSCEFKAGKVKIDYSIAALVDIPWAKSIRVVQHLRVGLAYVVDPERPPTLFKNEKSFLIHNNVPQPGKQVLFMQAYVDKPVTYTGDKITLFATVNNNSGRNVHSLKVKLKQLWSYGSGYFEKFTIAKIKHKDRKFPLSEGEYKAEIPMVVPNCDLRPTISNATLIRVSYHITLIASIRGGLDLRVRVPLIMASFPPATKKQMEEKKEEKKEEKPVEVKQAPLIDWDAPTPEQQSIAPLIPVMGSEFLPLPPSLTKQPSLNDADFFSQDVIHKAEPHPQFIQDLQLNTNVSKLGEIVNEMEAATHWAAAGQLEHAVDVDPNLDAQKTQQSLLAATKNVSDAIARLLEAAKHRPEQYMAASQDVAGNVSVLAHVAKEAASQIGEPQMQSGILHGSKTIALGSQQLLLQGKEIVNYDPFTSAYSKEFMVSTMEQTAKAVQDSCANLASFAQQAYAASYAKVNQVLEAIDALEKFLAAYNNPFGGESNDNATLEDVDKIARQFAQTTTQFVAACHGSSDDTIHGAQYLTKSLRDLLLNVKGVAKKYPVISQQLTDNAKAAGQSTLQLFKFTATALKKGSTSSVEKELNLGARENHQRAANIISLVGTEMQRRNVEIQEESKRKEEEERARKEAERALKEKVEFEDRAEQELIKAAEAIAVAAQKLQQAMKQSAKIEENDPFRAQLIDHKYDVIDASSSVAIAISELLRAASLAQAERAKQARDTRPENPYHKDPAWTEGLISAAKQVVALIEQLVTATTGEKQEEEVVISLARAITAATAQLMSAERAKGDLEGEAHKRLQAAARAVAKTTTELVQKMKDASEHKQAPQPTTEDAKADTANKARAQELEAQIRIAKLEKELEKARIDMHKLRKDKYGNT